MDKLKHLTTPLLLFAVLLIAFPTTQLFRAVWPLGLGNAEWRFGAFGLLSNALLQPMLGSFIIVLVATQAEKKWLQRAMFVLNGLVAISLLVGLPFFMLDSVELRSRVPEAAKLSFDTAALGALVVHGFAIVVLGTLSWGGFKSFRSAR